VNPEVHDKEIKIHFTWLKCGFWDLLNVLHVFITYDINPLECEEEYATIELLDQRFQICSLMVTHPTSWVEADHHSENDVDS
jgi:hypothetical protein